MSLSDSIFEAMGEFAVTVQHLVQAGWSFKLETGDGRYTSPKIIVTKGKRSVSCYDTGEVEKLVPVAEGVFDEAWDSMPDRDSYSGYDEGFQHCKQGWNMNNNQNVYWSSAEYKQGYLKGWIDAYEAGLFPKR